MNYISKLDAYYEELYFDYWQAKCLRFCDAFPALAYSFGIDFNTYTTDFPCYICLPDVDKFPLSLQLTVNDQIDYVQKLGTRIPRRVLDIGAGRGDLACVLGKMGIDVLGIEKSFIARRWFKKTGEYFFGNDFIPPPVIEGSVGNADIDFCEFDTVILCESLEHIREKEFAPIWNKLVENFKGLFIVTNFVQMEHIPIGDWGPGADEEHCRVIDSALYDCMCSQAKQVLIRHGSHLVLEF